MKGQKYLQEKTRLTNGSQVDARVVFIRVALTPVAEEMLRCGESVVGRDRGHLVLECHSREAIERMEERGKIDNDCAYADALRG
jgi:hypothetical protein